MSTNSMNLALARHLLEIGQPARALERLEQIGGDEIDEVDLWFVRGQALYDLKRYADAARAIREGLARAPESPPLLYLLCNCEEHLGNLAAAERAILSALHLLPESPTLLCRYALLLARGGELAKAMALVEEAARHDPEALEVSRTRAILAYLRGDDRAATRSGREVLSADPDDLYTHALLGGILSELGKSGDANRHLRHAARLDPSKEVVIAAAQEVSSANHWLLLPLRPVYRFGAGPIWLGVMATLMVLRAVNATQIAALVAVLYLVYCVYSWVGPRLLKWWLYRQSRVLR